MSELLKQHADLLLKKAYYALLEDVSRSQQKLLEASKLRDAFGINAILPDRLSRTHRTFTDAVPTMERFVRHHQENIDKKMPLVIELERVFQEEEAADLDNLAEYIRHRVKADNRKSKRGK